MNKQNKKSKNQVSTESLFKPIIATSLAVALGVSVSVGAPITSADITSGVEWDGKTPSIAPIEFNKTAGAPATAGGTNDAAAGLLFHNTAAALTLTGNAEISVDSKVGDAYGIYIKNAATTGAITSQGFNTITIKSLKATNDQAYVFSNAGTTAAKISGVGLVYGSGTPANFEKFGIHNALAGGQYDFGTVSTEFANMAGTKPTTTAGENGGSVVGLSVAADMKAEGKLKFGTITGGAGDTGKEDGQGGKGGDAVGILLGGKLTLKAATPATDGIEFGAIAGGAGGAGGTATNNSTNGGDAGNAYGIKGNGEINGGTIVFTGFDTTVQGGGAVNKAGVAAGNPGENTSAYAINGNVTLTDTKVTLSTTSIDRPTQFGILHKIDNVKYAGNITVESTKAANAAVGLELKAGADLSELTSLKVTGAKGGSTANGGDAVGIISDVTNIIASKAPTNGTITVTGGAGYGVQVAPSTYWKGGTAKGIELTSEVATFNKSFTFASIIGGSGYCSDAGTCPGDGGDAYGINILAGGEVTFSGATLTFNKVEGGSKSKTGKGADGEAHIINSVVNLVFNNDSHINVGSGKATNSPTDTTIIAHGQGSSFQDLKQLGGKYAFTNASFRAQDVKTDGTAGTAVNTVGKEQNGQNITAMEITGAANLAATSLAITAQSGSNATATSGAKQYKGGDATGIKLAGTLESNATIGSITAGAGGNGATAAGANGNDGGAGGKATGLSLSKDSSFAGSLTFSAITAGNGGAATGKNGNGTQTGMNGAGGDATGISGSFKISSLTKGADNKESYRGGKLIFNSLVAGKKGTLGSPSAGKEGKDGSTYVIDSGSGTITFDGVSVIADNGNDKNLTTTTYGLYHENIGKLNGGAVALNPQYKGNITFANVVNIGDTNTIGLDLAEDIDLSEVTKLSFGNIKNEGVAGNSNKDAIGMQILADKSIAKGKKELTFDLIASANGSAIGLNILDVTNTTLDLSGYNLTFKTINGGTSGTTYAIKNTNTGGTRVHSLTLDQTTALLFGEGTAKGDSVITHNGTNGIYQFSLDTGVVTNKAALITLGDTKNTALSFSGSQGMTGIEGDLKIDGVITKANNGETRATALRIEGGNTRAGEISRLTLTNGKTIAANITFDVSGATSSADAIGIDTKGTFGLGGTLTFANIASGGNTEVGSNAIGLRTSGATTIIGDTATGGTLVFTALNATSPASQDSCCGGTPSGDNAKGKAIIIDNKSGELTLENIGIQAGATPHGLADTFVGINSSDFARSNKYSYNFGTGTNIKINNKTNNVIGLRNATANATYNGTLIFDGIVAGLETDTVPAGLKTATGFDIQANTTLTGSIQSKGGITASGEVVGINVADGKKLTLAAQKGDTVELKLQGLKSIFSNAIGLQLGAGSELLTDKQPSILLDVTGEATKGSVVALGFGAGAGADIKNELKIKVNGIDSSATAIKTIVNSNNNSISSKIGVLGVEGVGQKYVIDSSDDANSASKLILKNKNATDAEGNVINDTSGNPIKVLAGQIIADPTGEHAGNFAIYHNIKGAGYKGQIDVDAFTGENATGMIIDADTFVDNQDADIGNSGLFFHRGMTFTKVTSTEGDVTGLKLGANLTLSGNGMTFTDLDLDASNKTGKVITGLRVTKDATITAGSSLDVVSNKELRFNAMGANGAKAEELRIIDNTKDSSITGGILTIGRNVKISAGTPTGAVFSNDLTNAAFYFGEGTNKTIVDGGFQNTGAVSTSTTILNVGGAKLTGNLEVIGQGSGDNTGEALTAFGINSPLSDLNVVNFNYKLTGGHNTIATNANGAGGEVKGFELKNGSLAFAAQKERSLSLELIGGTNTLGQAGNAKGIVAASGTNGLDLTNGSVDFKLIKGGLGKTRGEATAIEIADNATLTIKGGKLQFNSIESSDDKRYAINNKATSGLSLTIGVKEEDKPLAKVAGSVVYGDASQEKSSFGIYQGIAGLKYVFGGDIGTQVRVFDTEKTAVGLVLAANAEFESGNATFEVDGKEAHGIKTVGKDMTLTATEGRVNFNVGNDIVESAGVKAYGINAEDGKLFIDNIASKKGNLVFNVGNAEAASATGIAFNSTRFKGNLEFNLIQAKEAKNTFGIRSAGDSVLLANSSITLGSEAFLGVQGVTALDNTGKLTIQEYASIKSETSSQGFAAIDNGLKNVKYNLGDLTIRLGKNTPSSGVYSDMVGIRSSADAGTTALFSVAAGKTLEIRGSGYDNKPDGFRAQKAFDGVNLKLDKEATVLLGVDGGKIARLEADSSSTINLAGEASRTQDTDGIFYRSLTVGELVAPAAGTPATFAYIDAESVKANGANFLVLASRSGVDGELRLTVDRTVDKKEALIGGFGKGTGSGYAYNADGSLYTTSKSSEFRVDQSQKPIFDEYGNLMYKDVYSLNQGGSDRIIIDTPNGQDGDIVGRVNATLQVGVRGVEYNEKDNAPRYVVLAQVQDRMVGGDQLKDMVTFNGLTKDGDYTFVESKEGFDVVTIKIARKDIQRDGLETKIAKVGIEGNEKTVEVVEDWSNVGAVYYSDLRARDREINNTLADASLSLINTNYMLMSANLNSLNKRLGELRNTDNSQGLWGRLFAGQQSADFGMKQTTTYLTFQVGYDYNFKVGNGTNYVGAAISYISGSSTQDQANFSLDSLSKYDNLANASAKSNGFEAALYNTYVAENGFYSDSIFKVGYSMSNLNVPSQTQTYDVDNYSIALSEEVGYKVTLGSSNEWNITPQVELAYAFINATDFTQSFRNNYWMSVSQDAAQMLRTRVGVNWAYSFDHLADEEKGIKANLYVGTYYAYDANFGGKTNLRTNGGSVKSYDALKSDGRFVLNVGTDVSIQDATKFYVDFEKSFGGTLQTDYQFSVGVRYGFGAKNSEVKKDGEDKKAAPLKIKDEEQK